MGSGPKVDILAVGDNVVDRYAAQSLMYPGGNAVNVAVHARRCGAVTRYIGAVGTDAAGRVVLDALVQEGVDTSLLRVVDGPNAYADVRILDGNRVFEQGDIGVSRLRLGPRDLAAARQADIVHTGECSMLEDQLGELSAASRRLSFDFSERGWDYIERYVGHADIAIRACSSRSTADAVAEARRLRQLGPSLVAVTLGAGGAVLLTEGPLVHAPAGPGPVVDTLGAGDAFVSRLLAGLIHGEPLPQLALDATAYATASCASFGAFGYPTPAPNPRPARDSTAPTDATHHRGANHP